jgi:hypothetical protein
MNINETLYDFINDLNNSVKIGEDEYTEDFDSELFTIVYDKTGITIKTKITVFEDELYDADDIVKYAYIFKLKDVDLDDIDDFILDEFEVKTVIKNYSEKIRPFIKNQKKKLEEQLDDLNVFLGRIDKNLIQR